MVLSREALRIEAKRQKTVPATVDRPKLHFVIEKESSNAMRGGEYDKAVTHAFKAIEVAVRKAGRFPDNLLGTKLMETAFNAKTGVLRDLGEVERGEAEPLMQLFRGAIGYLKNPGSHRNVPMEAEVASRLLGFASYLMGIVEQRAERGPIPPEPKSEGPRDAGGKRSGNRSAPDSPRGVLDHELIRADLAVDIVEPGVARWELKLEFHLQVDFSSKFSIPFRKCYGSVSLVGAGDFERVFDAITAKPGGGVNASADKDQLIVTGPTRVQVVALGCSRFMVGTHPVDDAVLSFFLPIFGAPLDPIKFETRLRPKGGAGHRWGLD